MNNNNLLVISYNEGEQDFYDSDLVEVMDKITNTNTKPNIIVVSTQKSKSQIAVPLGGFNSTKHFPHVLGKLLLKQNYKLMFKKDASFMIRGVTENNNVRTRIYQLNDKNNIKNITNKLSLQTVGQLSSMTVNRQAIYIDCVINGKKCIFINTELSPLSLNDRKKEFLGLITEFELHKKFADGYNIIFSGSFNFRFNLIKAINEESRIKIFDIVSKKITNTYEGSNKKKLLDMNELKIYMNQLKNELSNKLSLIQQIKKKYKE